MRLGKLTATLLVAAACAAAVFSVRALKPNPERALRERIAERTLGDEKAKVWITEYFDYQCPPCARASVLLESLIAENPGKIRLQLRYFPLPNHKNAVKAAVYAECASRQKGKFWKLHKLLFANQKEWATDAYPQVRFAAYAEKAGLDVGRLDACAHDPEVEKFVLEEKKKGEALGVAITPSFFVNEKLVVGVKSLQAEVRAALEKEPKP